ncbi:MAG: hypothetical protein QG577_950 [Thermodesulfobacteriota bacterium]|nr:hypothetical protein [Thermodesulfobacteriota bacterium]
MIVETMPIASASPLTVVIINRNTKMLLLRCLEHVYRSHLDFEPRVVVVDNGSTDDSVDAARTAFPQTKIISTGKNLGFGAAVNRATPWFQDSRFLLLINTDAFLNPDCAQRLMSLMDSREEIGMAGPQLLHDDGSVQTSFEAVPTLATETLNRSLLKRLFPKRYPGKSTKYDVPTLVEALIGAVVMIRVAALLPVEGFDEDYFFFLEETDLAVRLRRSGWQICHHPAATAIHLQGATANTLGSAARIEFYRSRYTFFRKHYGAGQTAILKAVQVCNLSLNVLFLGLVVVLSAGKSGGALGRLRVKYALWLWHLRGCPQDVGLPRS